MDMLSYTLKANSIYTVQLVAVLILMDMLSYLVQEAINLLPGSRSPYFNGYALL